MRFLIITPAKNEADYIEGLIQSMISQTLRPEAWVIVDDRSTDGMDAIVEKYMAEHDWIHLVKSKRGTQVRTGGAKVVRAFKKGYEQFKHIHHDVVMKLDGDLTLPSNYLSSLSEAFAEQPRLGLTGGYCAILQKGAWVKEECAAFHVRGALKAYRKECYDEIGGIKETWNWDGLDNMMVMHAQWEIKVLDLLVKHHRPTSACYEPLQHAYRSGQEAYRTGDDWGLALIRAIFRAKDKPFMGCGIAYIRGYWVAKRSGTGKVVSESLATFIRKFQYRRILTLNRLGHGM